MTFDTTSTNSSVLWTTAIAWALCTEMSSHTMSWLIIRIGKWVTGVSEVVKFVCGLFNVPMGWKTLLLVMLLWCQYGFVYRVFIYGFAVVVTLLLALQVVVRCKHTALSKQKHQIYWIWQTHFFPLRGAGGNFPLRMFLSPLRMFLSPLPLTSLYHGI